MSDLLLKRSKSSSGLLEADDDDENIKPGIKYRSRNTQCTFQEASYKFL